MYAKWRLFLESKNSITEAPQAPKAIFMAGGPGSGKSTVLSRIGALDGTFGVVNADDYFEPMLKAAGLSLDLDHPEREVRSEQGKLFVQAQNMAKEKNISGVPFFEINDQCVSGAQSSEYLKKFIGENLN